MTSITKHSVDSVILMPCLQSLYFIVHSCTPLALPVAITRTDFPILHRCPPSAPCYHWHWHACCWQCRDAREFAQCASSTGSVSFAKARPPHYTLAAGCVSARRVTFRLYGRGRLCQRQGLRLLKLVRKKHPFRQNKLVTYNCFLTSSILYDVAHRQSILPSAV
jgi:hypothetical protein